MKLNIDYLDMEQEKQILRAMGKSQANVDVRAVVNPVTFATRQPSCFGFSMDSFIEFGASPRASILKRFGSIWPGMIFRLLTGILQPK
jgi:hypothetical protein